MTMLPLIDCHNHSNFSCDASYPAQEVFDAARQRGLGGVCITDHFDLHLINGIIDADAIGQWGSTTGWMHEPTNQLEDHLEAWIARRNNLRVADGNFLQLFGLELGWYPQIGAQLTQLVKALPVDQIIGSVHTFNGFDMAKVFDHLYTRPQKELYTAYLLNLIDLVKDFQGINVLGHFDFVSRYATTYPDAKLYYRDYADELDTLFALMIDRGISLEINTGYTKSRLRWTGPHSQMDERIQAFCSKPDAYYMVDTEILRRYQELGGELISLSSDSHRPEHTGIFFEQHAEHLRNAGIYQVTYFVNQQPQFVSLR